MDGDAGGGASVELAVVGVAVNDQVGAVTVYTSAQICGLETWVPLDWRSFGESAGSCGAHAGRGRGSAFIGMTEVMP
jgi:hypothetical protein